MTDYYASYAQSKGWDGRDEPGADQYFDLLGSAAGIGDRSKIVEVGFGNGDFLRWAQRRGHAPFGYELIPSLVARATASGVPAAPAPMRSDLHAEKVDVVAAFDVLEHMTVLEIEAFFREGMSLLKAGGMFLLRFPNSASPLGAIYQGSDVTHVTPLSAACIDQIASTVGLPACRQLRVRPYPSTPLARVRRWIAYSLQDGIEGLISLAYQGGRSHDLGPNTLIAITRP